MITLTQSMERWLSTKHRDLLHLVLLGHLEVLTEEMQKDYISWIKTKEGKDYLKGGKHYIPEINAGGLVIRANIKAKVISESNETIAHDLKLGESYQVSGIYMGQSYTSITLDRIGNYNSVIFKFYENGKEIDIYKDKRFNPYI